MFTRYPKFIVLAAAISLVASALLYFIHYLIFQDIHHIFIYMVGDFAFLPLEVFLVVIVIERLLGRREKQAVRQKLNLVVGSFFSEVGNHLLKELLESFCDRAEIVSHLNLKGDWSPNKFTKAANYARTMEEVPDCKKIDLETLKTFLGNKMTFLEVVLGNPHILEFEGFTNLLWATLHLAEELEARPKVTNLPKADLEHLGGDIKRMYGHLAAQWLDYAQHLKTSYPYLFSLILRTHPFQVHPSAVVR
jgi:hypothetical protein